jgi:uncharacterized protein YbcC (UPF0753/DUF2309 family)
MDKAAHVRQWVEACRPLLPIQNPLWAFVHNNILLNLEQKPFLMAVREAAALYRARPFESEAFFLRQLESGRIGRRTLGEVLLRDWPADVPRPVDADAAVRTFLSQQTIGDDVPPVELVPGPSAEHLVRYSTRDRPLQDWLVPLIASYLDQGLAPWPNPFAKEGLWACFVATVQQTPAMGMPWAAQLKARLQRHHALPTSPRSCSPRRPPTVHPSGAQQYCLQTLYVLKGWSGMVNRLEQEPAVAPGEAPALHLQEWLAVMLVSIHALDDHLRKDHPPHQAPVWSHHTHGLGRLHRWQQAYERTFAGSLLATLERDLRKPMPAVGKKAQLLVCMDDREESFRRQLERPELGLQTFGTVGFFGIDMRFLALGAGRPTRQCPPVVEPSRTIRELPIDDAGREWARSRTAGQWSASLAMMLYFQSRSLLRGLLVSFAAGLLAFLPLVFKLLLPSRVHRFRHRLQRAVLPRPKTRIDIDGEGGYSPKEQIDLVWSILRPCGLDRDFAPLVAVVEPRLDEREQPAAPGLRLRRLLRQPGPPELAHVRAAGQPMPRCAPACASAASTSRTGPCSCRTTTTRRPTRSRCSTSAGAGPSARRGQITDLRRRFDRACSRNAQERGMRRAAARGSCGRSATTPSACCEHVEDRGHDLAQPRPEYGHNRVGDLHRRPA